MAKNSAKKAEWILLIHHPAARGLQLISCGFPLVTKDDYETAEHAAFQYDAL
jgi:hypothetical protein